MEEKYDVVVAGGGAAGLGGALALARARRSVLVVDAGRPRNAPAGHVHAYLGREGTPPAELYEIGRKEVTSYGAEIVTGTVESASRHRDGFVVTLDGGRSVRARRLLITTGVTDGLPDVPGLAGRWGRDVLHCPYCHGYEVRDQRIGVLATGPVAWHQAEVWRQWSEHVTVILHGAPEPDEAQALRLTARGIRVVPGPAGSVEVTGDRLTGVKLASGEVVPLDALVVAPSPAAGSPLLGSLGLAAADVEFGGQVIGSQVPADPAGKTSVPGVWVAGNVADLSAQVITAAAAGTKAGSMINMELVNEDTYDAVHQYRHRTGTFFEREALEDWYRSRPALWSGRPNAQLVTEASRLTPGRVLDAGCGEGGDAIWLAGHGWQVTAVDLASTALDRGAAHAAEAGAEVAGRITWTQTDLRSEPPASGTYDLVSAQYLHLPAAERQALFSRLAEAVAPGGTLLLVGHDPSDPAHGGGHGAGHGPQHDNGNTHGTRPHLIPLFTVEEVSGELDPAVWDIHTAEIRERSTADRAGREATARDVVLVARRR
ncbi:FAD-dependent oxidoreductase [Longispora albida]|uniref:FAD-dependent oxidoreductase n=1 Tax=Longispora albida TaxID=203523 RepID=UPI000367F0C5|nr:FAD-dependent oxidoreductase [Longispora albida]